VQIVFLDASGHFLSIADIQLNKPWLIKLYMIELSNKQRKDMEL